MTDHLPQQEQRAGTRRAVVWWAIGGSLAVLAIVLVWGLVLVPQGQVDATRQPPGSGVLANQGSGQSTAARNDAVTPQTDRAVGAGQNAPGAAAQIEQTAAPLQLTAQQRQQIRKIVGAERTGRTDNVDFALSIGAAVPRNVQLRPLPPQISGVLGGFQGDQYVLVRDQLVIVDPNARRVVAIAPAG